MKKLLVIIMLALVGMNLQAQLPALNVPSGYYAPPSSSITTKYEYTVQIKGSTAQMIDVTEQQYQNLIKQHGAQNVKIILKYPSRSGPAIGG